MAVSGPNKTSMVVRLDGERLGHIAGGVAALLVMAVSLFVHKADVLTAFTRAGWSFVAAYGATFFLVRVILRVTLHQVLEDRRTALDEKRAKRREQRVQEQAQSNDSEESESSELEASPEIVVEDE